MGIVGIKNTFYIWQTGHFTSSRLIVNHTDTFLLVCSHSIQTIDTASDGRCKRMAPLMDGPVIYYLIFQLMDGEGSQLEVYLQQLSDLMDDDLPVDELQTSILFLVRKLFTESTVYRHLNSDLRLQKLLQLSFLNPVTLLHQLFIDIL